MNRTMSISRYIQSRRGRSKRFRILVGIAVIVVFVTTYMLILPALTQTHDVYCGLEEHHHTQECYHGGSVLNCGLEEHTHSLACYSNPAADIENEDIWKQSVSGVTLSGNAADDLIGIAETQLGYAESTANYRVAEDGQTKKGYNRYGAWYGDGCEYEDWDASFVSFCLHYAGISPSSVPQEGNVSDFKEALIQKSLYKDGKDYNPKKGDLVILSKEGEDSIQVSAAEENCSIGIVTAVSEDSLTVLQGDCGDKVASVQYKADNSRILGYGKLPEAVKASSDEAAADSKDTGVTETGDSEKTVNSKETAVSEKTEDSEETTASEKTVDSGKAPGAEKNAVSQKAGDSVETTAYEPEVSSTFKCTERSKDIKVTVSGDASALPVDQEQVDLKVRELTDREAADVKKKLGESKSKASAPKDEHIFDRMFDISLWSEGKEIEPTGAVTLSIAGMDLAESENLQFYHINEDTMEKEILDAAVEANGNLTAETEHFSIYGVTNDPLSGTAIGTVEEFKNLEAGGSYYLTADLTLSYDSEAQDQAEQPVMITKSTVLDLNGHTLTAKSRILDVRSGGSLTIKDSQETPETVVTDSTKNNYNDGRNTAVYDAGSKTLTYYVTVPVVTNPKTGATTEHVEKHTVTGAGLITATSTCSQAPILVRAAVLNIESGMIAGCNARAVYATNVGGAVINLNGGYLCGNNTTKIGSDSRQGGAVYTAGKGTVNLTGTVVAGNQAAWRGGGISVASSSTLNISENGVVAGNLVNAANGSGLHGGAGVWAIDSTLNLSGGYVTNNRFTGTTYNDGGAGVYISGGKLNISGDVRITGNDSLSGGGGVKVRGGNQTVLKMAGGFISSNHADSAEGAGLNLDSKGIGWLTGGYVTNNDLNMKEKSGVFQHWGGGGIFCSESAQLYMENVLVTDNEAGGFGGGIAGCSTGRISICVDVSAIYSNTASGTQLSGSGSSKHEDTEYAKNNEVFINNGFNDYFCALASRVEGGMLGGGTANWTGSCDGTAVTSNSKDDVLTATYIMGLTSHPDNTDKTNAQNAAKLYINGNYSYTHGGGVLANGYLLVGTPEKMLLPARIELTAVKALVDQNDESQKMTEGRFQFQIKDEDGNEVAFGKNDDKGHITFDRRLPFDEAGTFTYYMTEVGGGGLNNGVMFDSSVYRITVTTKEVKQSQISFPKDWNDTTIGRKIDKIQIQLDNVKIERADSETGTYQVIYDEDPGDNETHPVSMKIVSEDEETTFTNTDLKKINYTVRKEWKDGSEGKKPIQVELSRNGQPYGEKQTLSSQNGWTYTWRNLDAKDSAGNAYSYSVSEEKISGYLASYSYSSGRQGEACWVPVGSNESFESGAQYVFLSHGYGSVLKVGSDRTDTLLVKSDLESVSATRNTSDITAEGNAYRDWYAADAFSKENIFVAQNDSRIKDADGRILKSYEYASWLSDEKYPQLKTTNGSTYAGAAKITNGCLQFQMGFLNSENDRSNPYYYARFYANAASDSEAVTASKSNAETNAVRVYKKVFVGNAETICTITNTPIEDIMFKLNIRKVNKENVQMVLKDAKFNLLDSSGKILLFTVDSADGYYTPAEDGTGSAELISNTSGYIRVKDLPGGTYTLKEIEAPSGYAEAEDQTIRLDEKTDGTTLNVTVEDPVRVYELPHTGSSGTVPYALCGMVLMAMAAGFALRRRFSRD